MINNNTDFLGLLKQLPDLFSQVGAMRSELAHLKQNTIPTKPYYDVKDLAELMGVHRNTIYNKIKDGEIPSENVYGKHKIPHRYVAQKGWV